MSDGVCSDCRKVYTDDPSGKCLDCLIIEIEGYEASITVTQHAEIMAMMRDAPFRGPVFSLSGCMTADAAEFVAHSIGCPFGPSDGLWALSHRQAGDLLSALHRARGGRHASGGYNPTHKEGQLPSRRGRGGRHSQP